MYKYPLIKTFTLFSLLTFIITGTILSYFISSHIKNVQYENLRETAQLAAETLSEIDFENTFSDSQKSSIMNNLENNLTIYNPQSIILYNENRDVKLAYGFLERYQDQVNKKKPDQLISTEEVIISKPYHADYMNSVTEDKLYLDIYVPVKHDDAITGWMLLQIEEEIISMHIKALIKTIIISLTGGLLILYILLINILYRTSKTLINQNVELSKQKSIIEESYNKLNQSYKATISVLSSAVDARDAYTAGHSERVTKISILLGNALNLSDEELQKLEYAALFHDIGKIGVPDQILLKKGKLTDEEFDVIKAHPDIGVNILKEVDFVKDALPLIKHHHEKYGARGYPDNLNGMDIPLGSRIIAIADTYDAMTTNRPYRDGFSHEAAVEEINRNKGIQFDSDLVDIFMKLEQDIKNRKYLETQVD